MNDLPLSGNYRYRSAVGGHDHLSEKIILADNGLWVIKLSLLLLATHTDEHRQSFGRSR